jgi:Amino acid synthesis
MRTPDARQADAGRDWRWHAVISSNVKVAAADTSLDVPLGHKDNAWSFPHFDTITVSVADAPRPDEILVVMAIADGGRLRNRCGTEPIR